MKDLKDTAKLMTSTDYKDRFVAEYWQTKIRYEKLERLLNTVEAANATKYNICDYTVEMPAKMGPVALLEDQLVHMRQYLHILEVRAIVEGINLDLE